jgi:hypothetical protein
VKTFTTVTFSADTATIYENEAATTPIFSNKPAIKIEATDYVFNNQNSKKAYIAFDGTKYYVAYYDEALGKAINASSASYGEALDSISGKFDTHEFTITPKNSTSSNFTGVWLTDGGGETVKMAYNFTGTSVILGTSSSAEAGDVYISWTDENVGDYDVSDLTSTYGSVLKAPIKTNAGAQKVVIQLPPEQQKAFVYMGKIGEVTTAGGTYNKMIPVLTPIAKLDREITAADKSSTKAFVPIGGPGVHSLVAELAEAGSLK